MRLLQLPQVAFLKHGFDLAPERFLLTDRARPGTFRRSPGSGHTAAGPAVRERGEIDHVIRETKSEPRHLLASRGSALCI